MIDHLLVQDLQVAEGLEEDVADVLRTYDAAEALGPNGCSMLPPAAS